MCDEKYFVFYESRWTDSFVRWITQIPPNSQVVIFELDDYAPETYRQRSRCVTCEHFLTQKDFDHIDKMALRLAQSWYSTSDGDSSLDCAGISLGRVVEYEVMIQFVAVIKHLVLINVIRAREGSVTFVCFDRHAPIGQALIAVESKASISIEWQVERIDSPENCRLVSHFNQRAKMLIHLAFQGLLVFFVRLRHRFNKHRLPMQYSKVLFYSSFAQYLDYLKGLVADGFAEVLVYNPSVTSWRKLLRLDVDLILERPVLPRFTGNSTWCERWVSLQAKPEFVESFNYQGYSLWPGVRQFLENLFLGRLPELEHMSKNIANMLTKYQPDLVIVPYDTKDTPRLLILAAQSRGIPTLATEHGIISNYPYRVLPLADKIAVWGEGDVDYYLRHEYQQERLAMVGQPVLERLIRTTPHNLKYKGRRDLALDPDKPLILFAAQPYVPISARNSPLEIVALLQMVLDACRERADWQLVVKLHPAMDDHELSGIDTEGASLRVVKSGNIHNLISISDVVVTWCSTVGLEALVLGKPLIVIQIPGKDDYVPYVSSGAALGTTSAPELAQAIKTVLSGADATSWRGHCIEAFVRAGVESIYEGGAVDRFVNLAKQLRRC